ncbi:MAG: protein kinase, partial [archaeon]|nr:protein kinase [archaeon]
MGLGNSKNQIEFAGKIYTVERLVGRGAFGKVYVVATKDGELVALKQLSKAALLSKKAVQGTLREREFLAELEHGFLVNLRGAFQNSTHLLMLLDFMKGGDLTYHLDRRPGQSLPEDHVKFYIANICLCLEYVHSQRIVHRDLKPDNVLLNAKGYALLTDFNVARRLENDDKIAGYAGTFAYMAPE